MQTRTIDALTGNTLHAHAITRRRANLRGIIRCTPLFGGLVAVWVPLSSCQRTVQGATPAETPVDLAIQASRVLDPRTGEYSGPMTILVRNGRILELRPTAAQLPSGAARVLDLRGLTVMPGLIDAHVHLAIGGTVRANALADLRAGFTTVVDLGTVSHRLLRLADSINAGGIPGPRVLAAGIWVGVKGGVCEFTGIGLTGATSVFRDRVRQNIQAGAAIIKLCVSGWPAEAFAAPERYEMPDSIIAAAVDEAHLGGKLVVAHDISTGGVRAALAAGIDGFAHAAYLDPSLIEAMRRRAVFLIPTLASLTAGDTSAAGRGLVSSTAAAHRAGVRLVFGTDSGVLPHGTNAQEFLSLEGAGLSRLETIRAATVNAAAALRLSDSLGIIAPGMAADLIAVGGDPLADLRALQDVRAVVSRGRVVTQP